MVICFILSIFAVVAAAVSKICRGLFRTLTILYSTLISGFSKIRRGTKKNTIANHRNHVGNFNRKDWEYWDNAMKPNSRYSLCFSNKRSLVQDGPETFGQLVQKIIGIIGLLCCCCC